MSMSAFFKIMYCTLIFLAMPISVFAELDVYVQNFNEDNFYTQITIINKGIQDHTDLQMKIDDGEFEPLIKVIKPETGISISRSLSPGLHNIQIISKADDYKFEKTLNLLTKARTAAEAGKLKTLDQIKAKEETDKEFEEIREQMRKEIIEQSRKDDAESHLPRYPHYTLYLVLGIVGAIFLLIIIFFIIRKWVIKK